jgi:hypothetical protein
MNSRKYNILTVLVLLGMLAGCSGSKSEKEKLPEADPNNAGLQLPESFGAIVTADNLGHGRHMAVSDSGDLYVHLRRIEEGENGILTCPI